MKQVDSLDQQLKKKDLELKEIQISKEKELQETIKDQEERLRKEYEAKMEAKAQDRIEIMKRDQRDLEDKQRSEAIKRKE